MWKMLKKLTERSSSKCINSHLSASGESSIVKTIPKLPNHLSIQWENALTQLDMIQIDQKNLLSEETISESGKKLSKTT
jgi:hypothetical protein